jgi:hypothetical protein
MAKANLPVNFKDDILKENMNGKRRFNMIQNGDGTVSFEDVTEYTQVGSTFGAAQINATNTAVNNAADASKIIDNLETIKANTQSGYIAGALAVKALNSNLSKQISFKKLHSSAQDSGITNVSVSGYSQYLLVMCYGSNNDNPLDWGCSTSRGTTVQLGQQRSSRTSVAGACSAYIINVGDKNSVNISCRYHNNGATMIFGIE